MASQLRLANRRQDGLVARLHFARVAAGDGSANDPVARFS